VAWLSVQRPSTGSLWVGRHTGSYCRIRSNHIGESLGEKPSGRQLVVQVWRRGQIHHPSTMAARRLSTEETSLAQRTGSADLPLHRGRVPAWLASRMSRIGRVLVEAIVLEYGRDEMLRRLAHPFWFQSLGCVMGMDWHSSGVTTSVVGALKRGLVPVQQELGLYVCGGRGRHSRKTPAELKGHAERAGFDGNALARTSRMVAKVDSAAVQDSFDLYLHSFFVTDDGSWAVVQQGMRGATRQARRYHWLSEGLDSFVNEPHAAIDGPNRGTILNLTDHRAETSREAQVSLAQEGPDRVISALRRAGEESEPPRAESKGEDTEAEEGAGTAEIKQPAEITQPELFPARVSLPHLFMPAHHDVRPGDVRMRRLHGALAAAADRGPEDFEDLLMTPGVGARTVEALALASEIIYGAPCRFSDPARFSMAHGGKDGHPFPVSVEVYDRTINTLRQAVQSAKLGNKDRLAAIRNLDEQARVLERMTSSGADMDRHGLDKHIRSERAAAPDYGGRTVFGSPREEN